MEPIKDMEISENIIKQCSDLHSTLQNKVVGQNGQYILRHEFPVQIRATPSMVEGRFIYLNISHRPNAKTSSIKLNGFGNNSTPHIATVNSKSELNTVLWDISMYMTLLKSKVLSLPQMVNEYYDIIGHLRKDYMKVTGRKHQRKKDLIPKEIRDNLEKYDLLHQKHRTDLHRVETRVCRRLKQLEHRLDDLNNQIYKDKDGMAIKIKKLEQYNQFLLDYIKLLHESMED